MFLHSKKYYAVLFGLGVMCLPVVGAQTASQELGLVNGKTELGFAVEDGRVAITGITGRGRGQRFIKSGAASTGLWRIEFRPQKGQADQAVVLDEATLKVSPRVENLKDKGVLRFEWNGLSVGDQKNAADVIVTISAMKGTSLTDWRIAVRNRTRQVGLWQVDFPRVSHLFVGKQGEAATPFGFGMVVKDPVTSPSFGFSQRYPEALYSMQFASLSDQGSCLYLGTHDPRAYVKDMSFLRAPDKSGLNYQVRQFPDNMGMPGRSYKQPYPAVLGVVDGDWVDAAKLYRKWVLSSSDWMKTKKSLAKRTDLPDWFKRLPLWIGFHGMTDEAMKQTEAYLKYMDVPVADHFYHWHTIPFDHKYPDFWPPMPKTAEYMKRVQALNAKVMPYINVHLMDEKADSWKADEAWRYVAMGPDGKPDAQLADENRRLNAMCPATEYWQTKFNDLTVKLVRDLNVDGIYLDQVAAMPPNLCFDPTHGHPLGGGNYWVTGHGQQITNIRNTAAKYKKDVFLTTESAGEPYDFDSFLRVNEGAPFLTPIWQLVYSGYRLSYGFYFYEKPEWIAKFATQYIWGVQIGWAVQHAPAEMPEITAFEREVARARYAGSDYLALGEMLRDPQITGDLARYKTSWRNFGSEIPIDWPAVKGSLWRAPDGSVGTALVNMHSEAQTATVTVQRKELGFKKGRIRVRTLYPRELMPEQVIDGDTLTYKVTMPPLSAAMVVLESANAPRKAGAPK